jgi:hypothetical protein
VYSAEAAITHHQNVVAGTRRGSDLLDQRTKFILDNYLAA